jgi:hypothetical protein
MEILIWEGILDYARAAWTTASAGVHRHPTRTPRHCSGSFWDNLAIILFCVKSFGNPKMTFRWYLDDTYVHIHVILGWLLKFSMKNCLNFQIWSGNLAISLGWLYTSCGISPIVAPHILHKFDDAWCSSSLFCSRADLVVTWTSRRPRLTSLGSLVVFWLLRNGSLPALGLVVPGFIVNQ